MMERLTHPRNSGIKTGYWSPNKKEELINRLAEYEDTGLMPQEIYELKSGTILKSMGMQWIPVEERLPDPDKYVLVSFENFSLPMIGRYTVDDDDGGTFRIGIEYERLTKSGFKLPNFCPNCGAKMRTK